MPKVKQSAARPTRTTVKRVQATENQPFNPPELDHHPEPDTDEPGEEQLTPKQRRFVEAYVGPAAYNATEAAAIAGYRSENRESLAVTAHENLRKPNVNRAIARRFAAQRLDPGRTLQRLGELAFSNIGDVLRRDEAGVWRPDLDKAAEYAALGTIKKFKVVERETDTGTETKYEIEMHDSGPSLALLAKVHGLVKEPELPKAGETAKAQSDLAAIMGDRELYRLAVAYEERRRQLEDKRKETDAPGRGATEN